MITAFYLQTFHLNSALRHFQRLLMHKKTPANQVTFARFGCWRGDKGLVGSLPANMASSCSLTVPVGGFFFLPGLPPTPVQLLYPVSRFSNVKSLQHLCRFCIRQIVRIDHIQELPLPRCPAAPLTPPSAETCNSRLTNLLFFPPSRPLISYLSKFYYYDPEEEAYLSIRSIHRVVGAKQEAESQT